MEEQGKQRLRFTIGIVVVVLVLVRLVVGTSDEDSTLSRAASAQLAAAEGTETTEPEPTPSPTMTPPPPPPPVDENIVAMEAVPDEELIDDASGSDPSELTEDSNPGGGNSTPSRRPSDPRVAVDYRAF